MNAKGNPVRVLRDKDALAGKDLQVSIDIGGSFILQKSCGVEIGSL